VKKIIVNTPQSYPIFLGQGLLHHQQLINTCSALAREWIIITDDNVKALYAQALEKHLAINFNVNLISIPPGEESKTREMKSKLEDQMQLLGCGRDVGVLAVGGGMVTDLAGFVAATYCRGVPAVYVPTTLLAMVDATLGGKTGVNTPLGKNLIGTFTQPQAVFIDIDVLLTLDENTFLDGVIESIKHGLIADADFFDFLDSNADKILNVESSVLLELITRSLDIKRQIVEADELEMGKRAMCNFGHTIGHAIESHLNYSISHGMAVAAGIVAESYLSTRVTGLAQAEFFRIKNCLLKYGVRLNLDHDRWPYEDLKLLLLRDKKTRGKLPHFVLLSAIGEAYFSSETGYTTPVSERLIKEALIFDDIP
jgi:3-dehydroquinate synthase